MHFHLCRTIGFQSCEPDVSGGGKAVCSVSQTSIITCCCSLTLSFFSASGTMQSSFLVVLTLQHTTVLFSLSQEQLELSEIFPLDGTETLLSLHNIQQSSVDTNQNTVIVRIWKVDVDRDKNKCIYFYIKLRVNIVLYCMGSHFIRS